MNNMLSKIRAGLAKTRGKITQTLHGLFGDNPEQDKFELLEEFLLLADVGPAATESILTAVRESETEDLFAALREQLLKIFASGRDLGWKPIKVLVGINGTGKTTSIGKLCYYFQEQGKKVFVIGADTFRAAADMQLENWCRLTGTPFLMGKPGSDPGSVVYDGLNSAAAKSADVIICDTAGRLHVNKNLMQELAKIVRVATNARPDEVEVLLTLDAAMGQNALEQMEAFQKWVEPAGIILTKLDGSAKGGIALALTERFQIPIKFIGVGEGLDDLVPFSAESYVNSLLPEGEAITAT